MAAEFDREFEVNFEAQINSFVQLKAAQQAATAETVAQRWKREERRHDEKQEWTHEKPTMPEMAARAKEKPACLTICEKRR